VFIVSSCDYYKNEIILNCCKSIGVEYFKFNLNSDNTFNDTYDVVICSEVLEHTNINLKNGIKKLLTACHKDTILIITVPNIYSLNNLIRICKGINIVENYPDNIVMKENIVLDMREHKRECTKKDLLEAAEANNLEILDFGYCYTSTPFNHPVISKFIPPFLRPHIYGIFKAPVQPSAQ
jgi:2-polyprenyl-3-methyl-5-hydroxy-6-metoxy-1,4-benzoquinol methylase